MLIPLRDDNPTTITPRVTYAVMGVCIALYLLTLPEQTHRAVTFGFGYIPLRSFHDVQMPQGLATVPWPLTLVTYQFLHGGFLHLAGNMLYLWIFANNIEEAMGHARFAVFYLVTGVLAALAHAMTDTTSVAPLVGASGAISGVLGAYLLLFPHARVLCVFSFFVFFSFRVPAYIVIGVWFGWQVLSLLASGDGGGVAWLAHIGGLLAGLLLARPFCKPHAAGPAPRRSAEHHIESAPGGGYRVAGRWFPLLQEAEAYRRALDEPRPVQVHRRHTDPSEDRIVHNTDGSFSFKGRRYTSLDEAARALLDDSRA